MQGKSITDSLFYALSLIGIPYRWYRENEKITGEDKFWAANEPAPTAVYIRDNDLCIVCAGLVNLMRRYMGLSIPGLDGKMGEDGLQWPGTTSTWFFYLQQKNRLHPLSLAKKYPKGTLLLRNFSSNESDQGHLAILLTDESESIKNQNIIHSYAEIGYREAMEDGIEDVGRTGVSAFLVSHFWMQGGTYTHVCLPGDWLIKD